MPQLRGYFDTSVLVKRYVNEDGSFQARLFTRKYHCVTSDITPIEVTSALVRRLRLGHLSGNAFAAACGRLTTDRPKWLSIAIGDSLVERAQEVIRNFHVKTLDAIHIASALDSRRIHQPD
jgi:predicted nucleic acid-binding protein